MLVLTWGTRCTTVDIRGYAPDTPTDSMIHAERFIETEFCPPLELTDTKGSFRLLAAREMVSHKIWQASSAAVQSSRHQHIEGFSYMSRNLDPQQFRSHDVNITPLIEAIAGGKAVLFVGSGFARNAIGLDNEVLLTAEELAKKIGTLGNFDTDGDLRYASEKFIRDKDPELLVELLLDIFSIKKVLPHQISIASAPWRRIYTTNYDICIEEAGKESGKRIHTVSLNDSPGDYLNHRNSCIHLNGSIRTLTKESLNSTFKLSESSYLSADSFVDSDWYYPFKRDLEMCSALVFVGYSLYDIEIQKILFANKDFKNKTYFFTSPKVTERERFKLAPFGECVPIGAEGLAKALEEQLPQFLEIAPELPLTSIIRYEADDQSELPRDSDVERFLMYGDVKNAIFDTATYTDDGAPLLIRRRDLSYATDVLSGGRSIAIISDFGNGKTIFLRTLKSQLSQKGAAVYTVENDDIYNREDLETLAKSTTRTYLFIDSYDQHLDFLQHFSDLKPSHLVLVLAARTGNHDRVRTKLRRLEISFDEIVIDELDDEENERFVTIIDNVGFWGTHATLPSSGKTSFIKYRNKNQIQQALLSILQAPQIIKRVSDILKGLLSRNSRKNTVFAISLLSALDYPLRPSLISEVAGCNDIYDSDFRNDENFKSLFRIDGGNISSKSSLFSLALIRNNFEAIYVVNELLEILKRLNSRDTTIEYQQHELVKALLRFSGVERLFPEHQRINNLVRYYERVKRTLPWLQGDPHYWLQYGMALIAYDNFSTAQRMLDLAYEFAEKRKDYHTVHIDMQQSRLLLKLSAIADKPNESYKLYKNAIDFLNKVPDDFQKFRQIEEIAHVFNSRFSSFTPGHKNSFIISSESLLKGLNKFLMTDQAQDSKMRRLDSTREKIEKIITEGKNKT